MNRRWPLYALALCAATGFALLGRWQLHRAVEKQAMLDDVARVVAVRQPQDLAGESRREGESYAWVAGRGRFLPGPALLLDNQRRGDAVGVHVFRAFQPIGGRALLVDLGWLPLAADRHLPALAPIVGEQAIAGLLLPPPSAGLKIGPPFAEGDPGRWLMTRVDVPALSARLKLDLGPRVLRPDPKWPLGYARDLDVLPNTLPPAQHRAYAVQWFGLAAAVLALTTFLHFRARKA